MLSKCITGIIKHSSVMLNDYDIGLIHNLYHYRFSYTHVVRA